MDAKDLQQMINLARRAPLANMAEAEAVAQLLQRFGTWAQGYLDDQEAKKEPDENLS